MRQVRVYVAEDWSARSFPFEHTLEESDVHHLTTVLRLGDGSEITAFDRGGRPHRAFLVHSGRKIAVREYLVAHAADQSSGPKITIFQAPPRAGRLDDVIKPLSELGVYELVPIFTERGIDRAKKSAEKWPQRLSRWRRLAKESAKQCARPVPLEIHEPLAFDQALIKAASFSQAFVLDPLQHESIDWKSLRRIDQRLAFFVGPEGGFTLQEQDQAFKAGLKALKISPHILRCETAAIAAMAICQFMLFSDA